MLSFYLSKIDSPDDKEKFEKIYNQYRNLMLYIANGILHDHHLAEDAVHDAFIKIIDSLEKLEDVFSHKTKAFVVIVTENISKSMYTKQKKSRSTSFEDIEYEISDKTQELDELLSAIALEKIIDKIKTLSEIDNQILMLRYIHELKDKEIAKILDLKDSVVRKRLERARQRLTALLTKGGEEIE